MFGAQISDQLSNLSICERVAEGWHLLAAVEDLVGDFGRNPKLARWQIGEGRRLFSADAAGTMAIGTAFVAKKDCAGFRFGLGACTKGPGRRCGEGQLEEKEKSKETVQADDHRVYFLMQETNSPPPLGWCSNLAEVWR